jgi:hypothetical protein
VPGRDLERLPRGARRAEGAPGLKEAKPAQKKEECLPLKPARKLEFATDEGTWLSLDVSRDGRSVLFELLGHLTRCPSRVERPLPLLHAPEQVVQPCNVTYPLSQITRRDRVTSDEDTITDSPGSAIWPLLSPDGSRLVYGTRYEAQTGLRIRDLATGEERWLVYPVEHDDQESRYTRDFTSTPPAPRHMSIPPVPSAPNDKRARPGLPASDGVCRIVRD